MTTIWEGLRARPSDDLEIAAVEAAVEELRRMATESLRDAMDVAPQFVAPCQVCGLGPCDHWRGSPEAHEVWRAYNWAAAYLREAKASREYLQRTRRV